MAIQPFTISENGWQITFSSGGTKHKKNLNKYNWQKNSRTCQVTGCGNKIRINNPLGRCKHHRSHTADLLLTIAPPPGNADTQLPTHVEIIDNLIDWARQRNFQLETSFEDLAFNILGNIPDTTIIDGQLTTQTQPSLSALIQTHVINVVDKYFPSHLTSSYQSLQTTKGAFPVRILFMIFAGLLLCEEANRGDRWFCRNVIQQEGMTSQAGGAMPLVYFSARRFNWGVIMNSALLRRTLR